MCSCTSNDLCGSLIWNICPFYCSVGVRNMVVTIHAKATNPILAKLSFGCDTRGLFAHRYLASESSTSVGRASSHDLCSDDLQG